MSLPFVSRSTLDEKASRRSAFRLLPHRHAQLTSLRTLSYTTQILNILRHGYRRIGEVPIVLGETGCPFDLNNGEAFKSKDFQWQERMLDAICEAIGEKGLSNFK